MGTGQPVLFVHQYWMIKLRWLAGLSVTVGGVIELTYLKLYHTGSTIALVGCAILIYNAILWCLARRGREQPWPRRKLFMLVWAQILLDLVCLTILTAQTGGYESPLRGFFVFHMVFASLLLPRMMAFGVASAAIGMVEGTLLLVNHQARTPADVAASLGWDLTLLATVYLANKITRSLRRHRRRLMRQNRRIRAMSGRLQQQQQALAQQEKMVAMGQMAAGVAHEVANPLASMDGLLQLLERRPERITPENLTRLREQVARVNQIVRQLTTFAHPGEGEWQMANLNEVVSHALEVLRFDQRFKQVTLEKSLDGRVPIMRLQPAAIEQVIINMVINAIDAMEGCLQTRLGIRTEVVADEVRLMISDTGHGIAPELRERIFDPFFTTKPVGKGTGLGLSISYSLIRKHGGEITVESAPGKGALFTICLKTAPQSREAPPGRLVTPENSRRK